MSFEARRTVFVILSFEGPDAYSLAGGLGVRVRGLSRALAELGFQTHLYFCGGPDLPAAEEHVDGRLHLRRWSQWISAQHPDGVYDGEEGKIRDWNASLPRALVETVIVPAAAAGNNVVVMGEEWHTAWSMIGISDELRRRGLRDRAVMLWNANSTFGLHRIDWLGLTKAATLTTVSRYMKVRLWEHGQNPIVIPNGIPRSSIVDPDPAAVSQVRSSAAPNRLFFKLGRFDPDKRWLMAISAVARLKREGLGVKLLVRGGREAHGKEVFAHADLERLAVAHVTAPADASGVAQMLREHGDADVIDFTTFVADDLVAVLYSACDAVLANSGHEPFGLVGLEVMAAGGLAVTGSTGEDYAEAYRNALVLETADPVELVTQLKLLRERPRLAGSIRRHGRTTARRYVWDKVIEQLLLRIEFAAAVQGVKVAGPAPARSRVRPRPT
ncbi:MAG TPA: glycosyltransferase [Candidatus Dormibacteraeota bacterium]